MLPANLVSFAGELAAAARRETVARFGGDYSIHDKGSGGEYDPVTEADRSAEKVMRDLIAATFPDHGIRGEELADKVATSAYSWSLDPIDGTRSFVCGLPTWTTLIALLDQGEPVLGLIDAPLLDETYLGLGNEATLRRAGHVSRLSTSGCNRLKEARFSTTDPFLFGADASALKPVLEAVRVTRYGHDGYGYARLAAGSIDLVIECGLKPHDYNALIPVVRAAGGHFGDWNGTTRFEDGKVIAAASGELYEEAVELLAGA